MIVLLINIEAIATDFDFVLGKPSWVRYLRILYRTLKRTNPEITESLLSLPSNFLLLRILEYFAERVLLNFSLFDGRHSPLVNPLLLKSYSKYGLIGVFSRRSTKQLQKKLDELGYIDFIYACVGSDDMVSTIRKEYISKCIERLGVPPKSILVMSDSPSDLQKARNEYGAKICAVPTGYHSIESLKRLNPDFLMNAQSVFETLLNQVQNQLNLGD
ncbi:MAG: HAD hydrolase-like protein [Candidatus Aenigmatarchaeota archaeon]